MSKVVLVVDDFNSTRQVVNSVLEKAGYNIILAEDGESALEKLNERNVDLIVTDLNMPGINGIELVKTVRNSDKYYRVPVLMLTTELHKEKIQAAHDAGITGLMKKPFDSGEFLKMVERLLR